MPDGPYREGERPSPDDEEFARLAAEGQRKINVAAKRGSEEREAAAEKTCDDVMRVALGAHYGSPTRTAGRVALIVGVLCFAGGGVTSFVGGAFPAPLGVLGVVGFVAAIVLINIVPPKATPTRVDAERAWLKSLPFEVGGYFDLLATDGPVAIHVLVDLAFDGRPPDASLVQGALGVLDVDGRVSHLGNGLRIRGAALPNTFRDYNKQRENNNRQHVAYVHALIDRVLMPIHRSHPIASATLSFDTNLSNEESSRIAQIGFVLRKW